MTVNTPIEILEEDERRARMRLAAYRAKLYGHPPVSPIAAERRLHELERRWRGAAARVRHARRGHR